MGITLAVTSARSFSVVLGLHARPGGERQQGRMPHGPAEPAARCLVSISGQKIGFLSRESILPSVTSLKNIFQSKKKKKKPANNCLGRSDAFYPHEQAQSRAGTGRCEQRSRFVF